MPPITYETLEVGESFTTERTISQEDVNTYAEVTGDDNPIHVDPEYAKDTRFGKPIVHGAFLLGVISKVLGRDFPGHGSVAVNLSARFLRPIPVGSTIQVEIKVAEKIERHGHVRMRVFIYNEEGKMSVGGEATLIPPSEE